MPEVLRNDLFGRDTDENIPGGFYILRKNRAQISTFLPQVIVYENIKAVLNTEIPTLTNPELFRTIEDGDIASINSNGKIRVILSRRANHNTLLLTERCDNRCQFCSQPPKDGDDSWLLEQAIQAICAFNLDGEIGLSGGEPLLYRDDFIRLLDITIEHTPNTRLHVLTNGRAFADLSFTKSIARRTEHLSISFGVPLYAANSKIHDRLVSAEGAFNETVKGIINAGNSGINIELRFIPTSENVQELPFVAEYANRVFTNINQISVMNMEPMGWARKNWEQLYLHPLKYPLLLEQTAKIARQNNTPLYLFNYPLCHLPEHLHELSVQSISDWKNYYPEECSSCSMKSRCGGFFASAKGKFLQPPQRYI